MHACAGLCVFARVFLQSKRPNAPNCCGSTATLLRHFCGKCCVDKAPATRDDRQRTRISHSHHHASRGVSDREPDARTHSESSFRRSVNCKVSAKTVLSVATDSGVTRRGVARIPHIHLTLLSIPIGWRHDVRKPLRRHPRRGGAVRETRKPSAALFGFGSSRRGGLLGWGGQCIGVIAQPRGLVGFAGSSHNLPLDPVFF